VADPGVVLEAAVAAAAIGGKELGTGSNFYQDIEILKRGGCYERKKQRGQGKQEGAAEKPQREEKDEEGEEEQIGLEEALGVTSLF